MDKVNIYLNKLWYISVYTIALLPVLPRGIESLLIIILFINSLLLFLFEEKKEFVRKDIFYVFLLSAIVFIYLIGLIYSSNLKEGITFIIRVLPILIFALIFGVLRKNKLQNRHINIILNIHVISLFIALIFIQFYLSSKLGNTFSDWDYRQAFEILTKVHGTYYSLWIAFAIFILFYRLLKAIKNRKVIYIISFSIMVIYFLYWQITIKARLPLFSTILLLLVLTVLEVKKRKLILSSIFILFISILGITLMKPNYTNKIITFIHYDFSLPKGDYHVELQKISNEHIRNGIYYCSFSLVKKSWLFGLGIGDVEGQLQSCYKKKLQSNVYQIFNYNSHNQYLHILMASGIFGLIFFLGSLWLPIKVAIANSNILFAIFSCLIIISLLTENILSRHDGVIFYGFYNSIFVFFNYKIKFK